MVQRIAFGRGLSIAPHHRRVAHEGIFIRQDNARTRPKAGIAARDSRMTVYRYVPDHRPATVPMFVASDFFTVLIYKICSACACKNDPLP